MKNLIKILGLMVVITSITTNGNCQSICATPTNFTTPTSYNSDASFAATDNYTIRVYIHNIANDDGTNGRTSVEIQNAIQILQNDFSPHGICISYAGTNQVNSTNIGINFNDSKLTALRNADAQIANAINIYVLPQNASYKGGNAFAIPNTFLVMGGNVFSTNLFVSHVLSHELGHCLGLFHTFHGIELGSCPELVNGSNSTTCGDFIVDTPADPSTHFDDSESGCIYMGITTDANGSNYSPDMHNVMAYVRPSCMTVFTNNQGDRMRRFLRDVAILEPIKVPRNLYFQNKIISSNNWNYSVSNNIVAGNSVTSGIIGEVTINGTANVLYEAGNEVILNTGFNAIASSSNTFTARIDLNQCGEINFLNNAKVASVSPYKPMLNNNRTWLMVTPGFDGHINTKFSIVKDTVLSLQTYKKVKYEYIGLTPFDDWQVIGVVGYYYLREDTLLRRVYQYAFTTSADILLFDYNSTIGDSIYIHNRYFTLQSSGTVINSGNTYTSYNYIANNATGILADTVQLIEELGCYNGLVGYSEYSTLVCYKKADTVAYSNTGSSGIDCDFISKVEENANTFANISLYPNPANTTLHFKNIQEGTTYEIYGSDQKLMKKGMLQNNQISISDISSSGLYFCRLTNKNKTQTVSFIKQ